jgi:tubby-related protein 1
VCGAAIGSEVIPTPMGGAAYNLEVAMGRAASLEEDSSSLVMPEDTPSNSPPAAAPPRDPEEEARKRAALAQELDERGIQAVYDPVPNGGGPRGGRESNPDFPNQLAGFGPVDMKNFLLNPSPKNAGMIECRIIRERNGLNKLFPKYILESDAGVFLMTAKKHTQNKTSNYAVTMSKAETVGKETEATLGKLRSDFLGLEFVAYGTGQNPKKIDPGMSQSHAIQLARQELLAVQYSSSLWGSKPRGPRKMSAVIPRVQPNGERLVCRTLHPEQDGLLAMQKGGCSNHLIESYHNKPPKWNDQIGAFVLNFNKRVTQASVKNFQLTNNDEPDTVFLQFGRVGKDVFNMDFRYPFSPFQAFAICLSSFDYKLCCE